jgi:hypothetical protein
MKKIYVYVVQEITLTANDLVGGVVIGVYSTITKAKKAIAKAKKGIIYKKDQVGITEYDIAIMPMDEIPPVDDLYEKALYGLIEKGYMQALVGEDGYFYYELTEEGNKLVDKMLDEDKDTKGGETGID